MSPELILPQRFGFKDSHPTKSSDCYALGMVIYETISGKLPFHNLTHITAVMYILSGEHPPQGVRFMKSLWEMLEQCWRSQPNNRPSIKDVLECLESVSNLWEPHSPEADEGTEKDSDSWTSSSGSSCVSNRSAAIKRGTAALSSLDYLTDHPPRPVLTAARSSIVDAIDEADVDSPGREVVDLGPLTSRTDSNDGGTNQVGAIQSHKPLTLQHIVCIGPVHGV
jgi:hypothetical protein